MVTSFVDVLHALCSARDGGFCPLLRVPAMSGLLQTHDSALSESRYTLSSISSCCTFCRPLRRQFIIIRRGTGPSGPGSSTPSGESNSKVPPPSMPP